MGDRAALQLPDDAQLLVAGVILDADQGDGVRRAAGHGSVAARKLLATSETTQTRLRTVTSCPSAGASLAVAVASVVVIPPPHGPAVHLAASAGCAMITRLKGSLGRRTR